MIQITSTGSFLILFLYIGDIFMKSLIYYTAMLFISVSLLITPNDRISKTSLVNNTSDIKSLESSDWYTKVTQTIEKEEYSITYVNNLKAYQSPNRAQNLRFIYSADGFTAKPRTTKIPLFDQSDRNLKKEEKQYRQIDEWQVKLQVAGYGRTVKLKGFTGKELGVSKNKAFIEDESLKIEYENNEEGMRQNFIVKEKPEGNGLLKLKISTATELKMRVGPDAIVFINTSSEEKLKYSSLKAWDAENKTLAAHFEKGNNKDFAIVVNDDNAIYPVTIDPLSTTANWTAESNQANAGFGKSVSTAGDVNGDGYSDVIIGAYQFDHGEAVEGMAFLYYGSSGGLSATANWTAESDQESAYFGGSVSTAGDVNGDGYSDIVIGAYGYGNGETGEGRAYVYHGSSSGLSATANWIEESNQIYAVFGISVSTAGDVNGDGYSDIVIGAYGYDNGETDEGRAYVYHGSSSGLSATANWTAESNQESALFGGSVSTAGDVNGDGYSDVIIAASQYQNGQTFEGRVYVYHGSSSGLSTTANWIEESNQIYAFFGISVSTAGDVNGDGYSDIVIGAYGYDNGQTDEGAAFVYHGSSSGLSTLANWSAESNQGSAYFGCCVSTAGDVNGDGYSDVIVGALNYENGETEEGRAYVYYGSSGGLSTTAGWRAEGNQASPHFGGSLSTAGDVNGDGFCDIIIGASDYDNGETNEGRAFVYHGSSSGLSTATNWTTESDQVSAQYGNCVSTAGDVNGDGYSDVVVAAFVYDNGQTNEGMVYVYHGSSSGLSTTANWTAEGSQANAYFGYCVSTAGDINGDGYSDVVIGATGYENGQYGEGRAYVYHGSSSGLSATANWTAESNQENANFGNCVSTAGDVNGDGYSDVAIGAYSYDNGQTDEGRVFVYYGSSSGLPATANWTAESNQESAQFGNSVSTAGDVNGDGYSDVIIGANVYDNDQTDEGRVYVYHGSSSGLSASADWTAERNQAGANFGNSVSTAGDVNGDGYSDVIIGAYIYDNDQTDEGRAFVYHGSSSGLSATVNWTAETYLNDAYFGNSVSTAGDVNGDGYSDVIVGSYGYENGQIGEGRAYVFLGSSTGLSQPVWIAESDQAGAWFGYSVSSAGDVNGDGYSDVIVGARLYDNGETNEGGAFVYYGNQEGCKRSTLQQYKPSTSTVIGPNGKTGTSGQVRLNGFAKSPFGRADGKLVYQYVTNGIPFGSITSSSGEQPSYTDLGTTIGGVQLNQDISGIPINKNYRWRERIKYRPANNPYQVYSPWRYYTSYQPLSFGSFKPQNTQMVGVETTGGQVPEVFELSQNYPNPFNPSTTIEFTLVENSNVTLKIFDLLGREIAALVDGERNAGVLYQVVFDASKFSSGIYFYRLQTEKNSLAKKLMLVK
jgi:hypothetical protein